MRHSLLAAALCCATAWTSAQAQDLAQGILAVRDRALEDTQAWNIVESLTTEIGPRPVGSTAMERARDWGVAQLQSLGFQNVHVETFSKKAWLRGAESAEVVAPYPQKLSILGLGNSSPTVKAGLAAPIVLFHTFQAMLDQPEGSLKGKIAVVTQKLPRTQELDGYIFTIGQRSAGAVEAAKRGAVGYLVRSLSTSNSRLPHTGTGAPASIPAAALAAPDAELLERMVARGQPVTVRMNLESSMKELEAYNVVGEIRGATAPEEVVVIGGHLDSWDPGTGAIDDGAGVAITTAAAKIVGSSARQAPRRTIRVVMWGSEEQGGSGEAYLAAHKAEIDKIVLVSESDEGADNVWAISLPKGSHDHPAMRALQAAVVPLGLIVLPKTATFGGSDVSGLVSAGAPVIDLHQDMNRYLDYHHSADDTLDKVDRAQLTQNVAVWSSVLYAVANSDIDFRQLAAKAP